MAHIRQTAKGTWQAQITAAGRRDSKTFLDYDSAKSWSDQLETKLKRRQVFVSDKMRPMLEALMPKKTMLALKNIPYDLEEILDSAVPAKSFVGVYFLIFEHEVVYVGQSVDMLTRIARHRVAGKEFDSFSYMQCPRDKLDYFEQIYIAALMPWLNCAAGKYGRGKSEPVELVQAYFGDLP